MCSAFPAEGEFAFRASARHRWCRDVRQPHQKRSTSPRTEEVEEKCRIVRLRQAPRRSASQVPEHSPPFQEPEPVVPASLPEPVALLLPALTMTVTWPLLATLPLMVAGLDPSATRAPFWMRIG